MMAAFLSEAADALKDPKLREPSKRYADLGRQWSDLAHAALPDDVPLMNQARELYAHKAKLTVSGSRGSADEIRSTYEQLAALHKEAGEKFPLSDAECDSLRRDLQQRLRKIHADEVAARNALGAVTH
jgi:hypothetical protein